MKTKMKSRVTEQPAPFTPGITKGMVRDYADRLYRERHPHRSLTLEEWVMAEKDLVATMEAEPVI